jgi:hypothetical protein
MPFWLGRKKLAELSVKSELRNVVDAPFSKGVVFIDSIKCARVTG